MDIVYVLKNGIDGSELRYSLRSLKNFPHDKVWFYGGKPRGLEPDMMVEYSQHGRSKWEKVRNMLLAICSDDRISPEFWLFNDDFFCMKPMEYIPAYYNGSLYKRIVELEDKHGMTPYSRQLRATADILEKNGLGVNNYAVHLPLLIDRARAKVVLEQFIECPMFRSLYGNSCDIGGEDREDVKIYDLKEEPDPEADWLSTSNRSFEYGRVGAYIRSVFTEESSYER